jgi:hypothetical protein
MIICIHVIAETYLLGSGNIRSSNQQLDMPSSPISEALDSYKVNRMNVASITTNMSTGTEATNVATGNLFSFLIVEV